VLVSPGLSRRLDIAYHFCEIHEPLWASGPMVTEDGAWRRLFSAQRTGPVRVVLHPHLWGISTGENFYFCGLSSARFIRHFTRIIGCRQAAKRYFWYSEGSALDADAPQN